MKNLSRRSFITTSALATAGIAILPGLTQCHGSKNGKVNIAIIGAGGRGIENWHALFADAPGDENKPNDQRRKVLTENVVALCDVDERRAGEAYKVFSKAKRYKDFRKMFDEMGKEIDAVIISTPDHTHFPAAMAAMQLGKHVYVEKPLAHSIWQVRTLRKAASYYKVITQMGNQGHSGNGIRCIKEWYEAGILGEVKEVIAWVDGPQFSPGGWFCKPDHFPPSEDKVPSTLDWNLWLGPAAKRPYSQYYLPQVWRGWYDFGNGNLGDWACHTLDAPFWSLDLGMPHTVEVIKRTPSFDGFVSDQSQLKFGFNARGNKPPVTLTWHDGGLQPEIRKEWGLSKLGGSGMIMVGDKLSLMTDGRPDGPELLVSKEEWQHFQKNMPPQTIRRVQGGPVGEWLDAIKGKGPLPGSNFEYSARLTEMAMVGILAQRFNSSVEYDAENMKVTNHPELNNYVKEPVREGWSFGENLW